MVGNVTFKGSVSVRLTDERWAHITEEHCELAGIRLEVLEAVGNPDRILVGGGGELFAEHSDRSGKFLIVVHRETDHDGFVIIALVTRRTSSLERRR